MERTLQIEMFFVRKKITKKYEKVDGLEVPYHFTANFHVKAPVLMHQNKGFPSSTKPKTSSQSHQTPSTKQ